MIFGFKHVYDHLYSQAPGNTPGDAQVGMGSNDTIAHSWGTASTHIPSVTGPNTLKNVWPTFKMIHYDLLTNSVWPEWPWCVPIDCLSVCCHGSTPITSMHTHSWKHKILREMLSCCLLVAYPNTMSCWYVIWFCLSGSDSVSLGNTQWDPSFLQCLEYFASTMQHIETACHPPPILPMTTLNLT